MRLRTVVILAAVLLGAGWFINYSLSSFFIAAEVAKEEKAAARKEEPDLRKERKAVMSAAESETREEREKRLAEARALAQTKREEERVRYLAAQQARLDAQMEAKQKAEEEAARLAAEALAQAEDLLNQAQEACRVLNYVKAHVLVQQIKATPGFPQSEELRTETSVVELAVASKVDRMKAEAAAKAWIQQQQQQAMLATKAAQSSHCSFCGKDFVGYRKLHQSNCPEYLHYQARHRRPIFPNR